MRFFVENLRTKSWKLGQFYSIKEPIGKDTCPDSVSMDYGSDSKWHILYRIVYILFFEIQQLTLLSFRNIILLGICNFFHMRIRISEGYSC